MVSIPKASVRSFPSEVICDTPLKSYIVIISLKKYKCMHDLTEHTKIPPVTVTVFLKDTEFRLYLKWKEDSKMLLKL